MPTPAEYAKGIAGILELENDVGQIEYLAIKIGDAVREERAEILAMVDRMAKRYLDKAEVEKLHGNTEHMTYFLSAHSIVADVANEIRGRG